MRTRNPTESQTLPSVFHCLTSPHLTRKKPKMRRRNPTKTLTLPSPKPPTPNLESQVDGREEAEEPPEEEEVGFKLKPSASSRSLAVQPLGNLFLLDPSANARNCGLGALRILSDELLLHILGFLYGRDLAALSSVSRSFYVFAGHEPLWRNLVLEELKGDFLFDGSWKSTYVSAIAPRSAPSHAAAITIRNFYSDYLFQCWLCANLEMKPEWLERDLKGRVRSRVSGARDRRNRSREAWSGRIGKLRRWLGFCVGCLYTRKRNKYNICKHLKFRYIYI